MESLVSASKNIANLLYNKEIISSDVVQQEYRLIKFNNDSEQDNIKYNVHIGYDTNLFLTENKLIKFNNDFEQDNIEYNVHVGYDTRLFLEENEVIKFGNSQVDDIQYSQEIIKTNNIITYGIMAIVIIYNLKTLFNDIN